MIFKKSFKILIMAFFIFTTTISTNAMKQQTQIKTKEDVLNNTINNIENSINEFKNLDFKDMICSTLLKNLDCLLKYDYDLKTIKEELTKQYNIKKINELKIIINDEINDEKNINKINELRFTINELGTKILKIYIEKFEKRNLKNIDAAQIEQEINSLKKEKGTLIIIRQRLIQHKLFNLINKEIENLMAKIKDLTTNLKNIQNDY